MMWSTMCVTHGEYRHACPEGRRHSLFHPGYAYLKHPTLQISVKVVIGYAGRNRLSVLKQSKAVSADGHATFRTYFFALATTFLAINIFWTAKNRCSIFLVSHRRQQPFRKIRTNKIVRSPLGFLLCQGRARFTVSALKFGI